MMWVWERQRIAAGEPECNKSIFTLSCCSAASDIPRIMIVTAVNMKSTQSWKEDTNSMDLSICCSIFWCCPVEVAAPALLSLLVWNQGNTKRSIPSYKKIHRNPFTTWLAVAAPHEWNRSLAKNAECRWRWHVAASDSAQWSCHCQFWNPSVVSTMLAKQFWTHLFCMRCKWTVAMLWQMRAVKQTSCKMWGQLKKTTCCDCGFFSTSLPFYIRPRQYQTQYVNRLGNFFLLQDAEAKSGFKFEQIRHQANVRNTGKTPVQWQPFWHAHCNIGYWNEAKPKPSCKKQIVTLIVPVNGKTWVVSSSVADNK